MACEVWKKFDALTRTKLRKMSHAQLYQDYTLLYSTISWSSLYNILELILEIQTPEAADLGSNPASKTDKKSFVNYTVYSFLQSMYSNLKEN